MTRNEPERNPVAAFSWRFCGEITRLDRRAPASRMRSP